MLCIAIPVAAVGTMIQIFRKGKIHGQKRAKDGSYAKDSKIPAGAEVPGARTSGVSEPTEADPVQERERKAGTQPLKEPEQDGRSRSNSSCMALTWYQMEGRIRILRLVSRLEKEAFLLALRGSAVSGRKTGTAGSAHCAPFHTGKRIR